MDVTKIYRNIFLRGSIILDTDLFDKNSEKVLYYTGTLKDNCLKRPSIYNPNFDLYITCNCEIKQTKINRIQKL